MYTGIIFVSGKCYEAHGDMVEHVISRLKAQWGKDLGYTPRLNVEKDGKLCNAPMTPCGVVFQKGI